MKQKSKSNAAVDKQLKDLAMNFDIRCSVAVVCFLKQTTLQLFSLVDQKLSLTCKDLGTVDDDVGC